MYNFDLLPVLISLVIIASVVLWVAIRNYKNFILMFLLIPLTLASGWTIYTTIDALLGYPVVDEFKKDTMYVAHFENPDIADWIYVWVIQPGDKEPKAIMIPNTENNQEQLQTAADNSSQGIPTMLEMEGEGGFGQTNGGEVRAYDFQDNLRQDLKDEQRERDQQPNFGPIQPGPPHHTGNGPTTRPTQQLKTTPKVWGQESTEVNPYQFDWYGETSDEFLP